MKVVKTKSKNSKSVDNSQTNNDNSTPTSFEIFKIGMNFENTIEYIESKTLDSFFGHICRQGEWDLANQYMQNVQEWVQMLLTTAKLELNFLPKDLQEKIVETSEDLKTSIENLLKTIEKKDFDEANKNIEKILKIIRNLYKVRE